MITSRFPRLPLPLLALTLSLSLPILAGCGLKGDLYLPDSGTDATPESLLPEDEEPNP